MSKKIGLSLGAGGAKGLAHIGVLQVLKREEIPIDYLAGTSIGALIGASFAAGNNIEYMAKLACRLNQSLIVDVTLPRLGLIKGQKVMELIQLLTHDKSFEQLDIPFAVIATDVEKGERVVLREGNVAKAVRASVSVPGIFRPVRHEGRILVDGAVTERLPVSILKDMGADYIIGVDLKSWPQERAAVRNIYEVIMQSIDILENQAFKHCLEMVDVLIAPNMSRIGTSDFKKGEECISLGRAAAELKLEQIKRELQA